MEEIMQAATLAGVPADQREAMKRELEERALEKSRTPETWPPVRLNRATRRSCKHRMKSGYCVDCGEVSDPVAPGSGTEGDG